MPFMLSVVCFIIMLTVVVVVERVVHFIAMLNVFNAEFSVLYCYADCHYYECHVFYCYADCHYANCRSANHHVFYCYAECF
jgi:hypothetical protein